jgi:hypothetical protein
MSVIKPKKAVQIFEMKPNVEDDILNFVNSLNALMIHSVIVIPIETQFITPKLKVVVLYT